MEKKQSYWQYVLESWGLFPVAFITCFILLSGGFTVLDYYRHGDTIGMYITPIILALFGSISYGDYYINVLKK